MCWIGGGHKRFPRCIVGPGNLEFAARRRFGSRPAIPIRALRSSPSSPYLYTRIVDRESNSVSLNWRPLRLPHSRAAWGKPAFPRLSLHRACQCLRAVAVFAA